MFKKSCPTPQLRRLSPIAALSVVVIAVASSLLPLTAMGQSVGDSTAATASIQSDFEAEALLEESGSEFDFLLVQNQPPTLAESQPEPPARTPSVRRRRRTYELPPMFGDLFGGSTYQASVLGTPVTINQSIVDGQGGIDLFVRNLNGGAGADPNPAVGIVVENPANANAVIATSIGPGIGGTGQAISFPISEPFLNGISPPTAPAPGTITYGGGTATYAGAGNAVGDGDNWQLDFSHIFTPTQVLVNLPSGGAVGRSRISENNSPDPRARFFWNYNYYSDVIGGIGEVNRHTFGVEQPLTGGGASIELRVPFAGTLATDQVAGGVTARDTEFGDLMAIFKTIVAQNEYSLTSIGVGVTGPTAADAQVFLPAGTTIMRLGHRSVRILPFVGTMHSFDSDWYWQSFVQLDLAASGDPLAIDLNGSGLQHAGVLQEPHLLYCDVGVGRWISGGPGGGDLAIAATAELHYAATLRDADTINTGTVTVTNTVNRYDLLNLTLGLNIAVNNRISVRPALVVPLHDRQFDIEMMVQANVQ